jgi:hypothetical protein
MYRIAAMVVLLLSPCLSVLAQTAAQRALDNEPEAQKIQAISQALQTPQRDPLSPNQGPSLGQTAINATVDMREMNRLLDQLEERLNRETRACSFCSAKQEELSELIRQRMALVGTGAQALGHDRAGFMMKLAGITPTGDTRWTNIQIAFHESAEAVRAHCAKSRGPDEKYCDGDGMLRMAADHERAWAACFNQNNWVDDAAKRRAYETCMTSTDPLMQMCARDTGNAAACTYSDVSYMDVDELHFWHDRFNVDPTKLSAGALLVQGQAAHVTLLEPIVAPPGTATGGPFGVSVRARLDNALVAQADPANSGSATLQQALTLDPQLGNGLKGRFEAIPAGTEIVIQASVAPRAGQPSAATLSLDIGPANGTGRPTNGRADARAVAPRPASNAASSASATAAPVQGLRMQRVDRQIAWPQAGATILAANTEIAFVTACGCQLQLTLAELKQSLAAHPVSAAAPTAERTGATAFTTLVIPAGSYIDVVLREPVTVSGIEAGKRFHAQLNSDLERPPGGGNRDDVLELRKGEDAYYKVVDMGGLKPSAPGQHQARLTLDYLVLNGKQSPVKIAGGVDFAYNVAAPGARQTQPDVIIPVGMRKNWRIEEDIAVATAALSANEAKRKVPPPEPRAQGDALRRDVADYNDSWIGHAITLHGVVSRVVPMNQYNIGLHFKESPDDAVVVCLKLGAQISQTTFNGQTGGSDLSAFAGKTIEVTGLLQHPFCSQNSAGFDVYMPDTVKVVGAASGAPAPSSAAPSTAPAPARQRAPARSSR